MYLEYDWVSKVYRPRLGNDVFTDIDGHRSFKDLTEARYVLRSCGLKLGRKVNTLVWTIVCMPMGDNA